MPLSTIGAMEGPLSLGLRTGGTLLLSRYADDPLAPQADASVGLDMELAVARSGPRRHSWFLGLGTGLHWTSASPILPGGILYRGFSGSETRLLAGWSTPLTGRSPDGDPVPLRLGDRGLRAGLLAGGAGRLERYRYTELYFFAPSLFVEPFLELEPPPPAVPAAGAETPAAGMTVGRGAWLKPDRWGYRLALPLTAHFRRDMKLGLSFGLAAGLRLHPSRKEAVK